MLEDAGDRTLLQRLEAHAARTPHRPFACLYRGEAFQVLTYGDLLARADAWGARIAAAARTDASRVAFIVLPHGFDLYAAYLGAMRAGLLPSFLPPPSPRQDPALYAAAHARVIARTDPAVIVAGAGERAVLAPLAGAGAVFLQPGGPAARDGFTPAAPDACDLALLQHSSGTTGLKKAVALSFGQVDAHVGMVSQALNLGPGDIVASWLPLYHDMGLFASFLIPLSLGASVVAMDAQAWVADPMSLLRAIAAHRATVCWMPNFAFAHLSRSRGDSPAVDLTSLRALVDCSEPCRPETLERFAATFADCGVAPAQFAACYGMAEVIFAATQTRPGRAPRVLALDAEALELGRVAPAQGGRRARRLLSCGPPLAGVELRIDAGYGRTGEILIRSATRVEAYFAAEGPDVCVLPGGWRRSGDVGLIDGGELFVCGRLKEMLIVNGRNLYAGDVEAVVSAVPGVKPGRAVALAVEDADAGTQALAVMLEADPAPTDAAAEAELKRAVRRAVAGAFDVLPRTVAIGPPGWLVKSTAGKMSRAENLARLRALLPSPSMGEGPGLGVWAGGPSSGEETPPVAAQRLPDSSSASRPHPHPNPSPIEGEGLIARALADCFGLDPSTLTPATSPDDVAGWDSLAHTTLILRIEALAGVRLGERAAEARTVGDLAAAVAQARARTLAA